MNEIDLKFSYESSGFDPGSELVVDVQWNCSEPPSSIEVRLVWSTSGKGDLDLKVVKTVRLDGLAACGTQQVQFALPWGPYSFSGKLISLIWAVEAVAFPSNDSTRLPFTLAPQGREVLIDHARLVD